MVVGGADAVEEVRGDQRLMGSGDKIFKDIFNIHSIFN